MQMNHPATVGAPRESDLLLALLREVSATEDAHRLTQAITQALTQLTGAAFGAFFYNTVGAHGESYMLYSLAGLPADAFATFPMPRNTEVFGVTFRGEGTIRLDDVTQDERYGRNPPWHGMPPGHPPVRSYLAVPVVLHSGQVLGGLFLGHPNVGCFTQRHEELASGVATVAAVALDGLRLRAQVRQDEQRYRTLAETMTQLAWIARADGWIYWYNRRWYEYTGTTPDQMAGWGWQQVHDPVALPDVVHRWRHSIASGQPFEMTFPLRGADGVFRPFLTRAVPVKGEDGQVLQWFGTNTDISEQRLAQRALEEADRKKDEFLAVLAHELRNPLAPIRSGVEILQRQGSTEPTNKRIFDIIERQAGHLSRLVDDLMDVSRITLGRIELRREWVDVETIVQEAVEESRSDIEARGHAFGVRVAPAMPLLWADPTRCTQILANLLGNAAKYTPQGGHIDLNVFQHEGRVRFVVQDSGIGIDNGRLESLFELFAQAEPGQHQSHGGLGIGLALVRGLVRLHHGDVQAFSEGPGKGSIFVVSLPIGATTTDSKPQIPAGTLPQQTARREDVLVVDDNVDAATTLSGLLHAEGHRVRVCYSGESALTEAAQNLPDVVLLDVGLPDMNGFDVARRMRSMFGSRVRIALVTGWGQPADVHNAAKAGADIHFTKPVAGSVLLSWMAASA